MRGNECASKLVLLSLTTDSGHTLSVANCSLLLPLHGRSSALAVEVRRRSALALGVLALDVRSVACAEARILRTLNGDTLELVDGNRVDGRNDVAVAVAHHLLLLNRIVRVLVWDHRLVAGYLEENVEARSGERGGVRRCIVDPAAPLP